MIVVDANLIGNLFLQEDSSPLAVRVFEKIQIGMPHSYGRAKSEV